MIVLVFVMLKDTRQTMLAEWAKSLAKLVKVGPKDLISEHGVIKRKPVATSVNADTEIPNPGVIKDNMSSGIEVWKIDSKTPKAEIENVLRQLDEANRASIQNALIVPKDGKPSQIERVITSSMTGSSATVISSIANNRLTSQFQRYAENGKWISGIQSERGY